jgi:hypothetical protein
MLHPSKNQEPNMKDSQSADVTSTASEKDPKMKRQNRQERSDGRQQPSFRRWGSIKSVGRIVKNEDGLAGEPS